MKKTLKEDLERIHELTYGKRIINESGFIDKILNTIGVGSSDKKTEKVDDPKKADFVSSDVDTFFTSLKSAADSGGLEEKPHGGMDYQKEVESMQIGLMILGYDLPKHGVDGLFGPETASAVSRFMSENGIKEEGDQQISEEMTQLKTISYPNLKHDFTNGTENDFVNQGLLDDLNKAASAAGLVATITTAKSGHDKLVKGGKSISRHMDGTGVDIAILDGTGAGGATNSTNGNDKFRELGNRMASALESLGYVRNVESGNPKAVLWQTNTGGNHFNHLHVSNKVGASELPATVTGSAKTKATPKMLNIMIDMLRQKNITSEELKKYIDKYKVEVDVSGITDESFYKKLLENLGAPITDSNLQFLYAWRQAEGKAGKYNPFNTTQKMAGATNFNSVGVKNYLSIEDGMVATVKTLKNGRYECIVNGLKNDIGALNIASCESLNTWGTGDLVYKVLQSYASGSKPKPKDLA
jgi:peptidoglycan hydrolase-like protein with peptidoglycan-binding domain